MKKNTIKSLLSVVIISSLFQGALQAMNQNNPQYIAPQGQADNAAQIPTTTVPPVQNAAVAAGLRPIISAESVRTTLLPVGTQHISNLQERILLCTQYLIAERAGANRTDVKAALKTLIKELKNRQNSLRLLELSRLEGPYAMRTIVALAVAGFTATDCYFFPPKNPWAFPLVLIGYIALADTIMRSHPEFSIYDADQAEHNDEEAP